VICSAVATEHVYASVFCTTADFNSIAMGEVYRKHGGSARMLAISFLPTLSAVIYLGTVVMAF